MRIIAGTHRGLHLAEVGKGDAAAHLRPTTDRVREAIFNLILNGPYGNPVAGARVLDLFAGTGALGLEALSRGAARVTFVEDGAPARALIRRNVELCRAMGTTDLYRRDATRLGENRGAPFSLVFLDPPYGKGLGEAALASAAAGGWLAPAALVVWEENTAPRLPEGFAPLDQRRYGDTLVTLARAPRAGALLMRFAAVVFDCDGVLVDSEQPTFVLLAEEFARHGLALSAETIATDFAGGTMRDVWARARAAGARLPEDWVETFYERLYARLAEGTPLVAGVEAVLDALDAAGIPYAVGSNGSDRKMQVTLGQHPTVLARLHGRLFSGQTLGRPKPAPDLYLHAAAALGAAPAATAVIEDSPTGARAARAAGMACFGYAAHGEGDRLAAEGARVFTAMAELPALLGL